MAVNGRSDVYSEREFIRALGIDPDDPEVPAITLAQLHNKYDEYTLKIENLLSKESKKDKEKLK